MNGNNDEYWNLGVSYQDNIISRYISNQSGDQLSISIGRLWRGGYDFMGVLDNNNTISGGSFLLSRSWDNPFKYRNDRNQIFSDNLDIVEYDGLEK
jgi:hypothetical protein